MKRKIVLCLWFDDQAEEAAKFYVSIFKNSRIIGISHYGKEGAKASGRPIGSVLTVDFEIEGQEFLALNGGPVFSFTPAISFYVSCESASEVDLLYNALRSEKSEILMPLGKYPFSERYVWFKDRYGLSWQMYLGSGKQKITPCLMFVQQQYGKAQEAMKFYVSVFNESNVEMVVPYEKGEGEKEGAVKHAAFSLDGERFIAIDSGLDHKFTFTPAISFMVNCKDQKEIDYFWKLLSAVPEAEQCGWLQDKYGVSWQIVPDILGSMTMDTDPKKSERVMQAIIKMKKLDIEILKQAYQ
jgi:predicted 3-demethylubiquinone-9 3-methyltransferase (glyoxalase superfamily)